MNKFFGVIGILAGIVLGIYLGVYVLFVGGLVDIIKEIADAINGQEVSVIGVFWGIVKMCVSGIVGWFSAFVVIILSSALMVKD